MPITQQALDVHQAMSSGHFFGARSGLQFRIVVKTIAGKKYEITELRGSNRVENLKTILKNSIIPTPSTRRMTLVFENNILDDNKRLREYNICEGSELDLVMLSPPLAKGSYSIVVAVVVPSVHIYVVESSCRLTVQKNVRSFERTFEQFM